MSATLSILSGAHQSAESITVTDGQYLYVQSLTNDVTWGGTSQWLLYLDLAGASDPRDAPALKVLHMHNGFGDWGHSFGTWESPDITPPTSMHVSQTQIIGECSQVFAPGTASGDLGVIAIGSAPSVNDQGLHLDPGTYYLYSGNPDGDHYWGASGYTGSVVLAASDLPPEVPLPGLVFS